MEWKKISMEQRKYIVVLLLMTIVGISLILFGNGKESSEKTGEIDNLKDVSAESNSFFTEKNFYSLEREKEKQLVEVLAAIEGVGKVWVDITFAGEGKTEYAYDEQRTEKENYAETENAAQVPLSKEVQYNRTLAVVSKGQGQTEPIVVSKENPKIIGVLVVAQGADNPVVEADLLRSVETLLGVAAHEVVIMAADSKEAAR